MVGQQAKLKALRFGTFVAPSRWRDAYPLTLKPVISSVPLPMMFTIVATPAKSSALGPPGTAQKRPHSLTAAI